MNANKETKKEYRRKIRAYNREKLHEVKKGKEVVFETSKNRFSDYWNWD